MIYVFCDQIYSITRVFYLHKVYMNNYTRIFLIILFCGFVPQVFAGDNLCKNYPHWDCSNPTAAKTIAMLENFISAHPHKGIAAFDWDGTLYDEHLPNPDNANDQRSGQSVWHIWAANHLNAYHYLFPSFKTGVGDNATQAADIKRQDDYLEAKTLQPVSQEQALELHPRDYDKFSQLIKFESGMTLEQMRTGINAYLKDYSPKNYAYKKMLDIVQRLTDTGFTVWIVSGSNTYYLANLLTAPRGINAVLSYNIFAACEPQANNLQSFLHKCFIAGNASKLWRTRAQQYRFSAVYDDRFLNVELKPNERTSIDNYGKQLVLRALSKQFKLPVVFYAGNSDGDYDAMSYVLNESRDAMGIFVEPARSHSKLLKPLLDAAMCKDRCIDIEDPNRG